MISYQILLVPRILFHPFIVVQAPENSLTEAVEVRHVGKLRVVELGHKRSRGGGVVNLGGFRQQVVAFVLSLVKIQQWMLEEQPQVLVQLRRSER